MKCVVLKDFTLLLGCHPPAAFALWRCCCDLKKGFQSIFTPVWEERDCLIFITGICPYRKSQSRKTVVRFSQLWRIKAFASSAGFLLTGTLLLTISATISAHWWEINDFLRFLIREKSLLPFFPLLGYLVSPQICGLGRELWSTLQLSKLLEGWEGEQLQSEDWDKMILEELIGEIACFLPLRFAVVPVSTN